MTEVECIFCKIIFELDEEKVKDDKYIECPYCGGCGLNTFYKK